MRKSRFSFAYRLSSNSLHSGSSDITEAENLPWNLIGDAEDNLFNEVERLYWIGTKKELESVLRTLRAWQAPQYQNIGLEDESDSFVHGFDTFIDQVSETSRAFADRVAKRKNQDGEFATGSYLEALHQKAQDMASDQRSSRLKTAIRQAIEHRPNEETIRRRTRMLLQAVGFLDIEKLVEHRPPLDELSFWKRPATPQLELKSVSKSGVAVLAPMRCSSCLNVIRSSMYRQTAIHQYQKQGQAEAICEDCYRNRLLGTTGFVKTYKHCILREAINPQISRQICFCDEVPHRDTEGKPLSLFPVDNDSKHIKATGPGLVECGLLKLSEIVAEAKYDGMQTIVSKKQKKNRSLVDEKREDEEREALASRKGQKQQQRKVITQQSQNAPDRTAETGTSMAVAEAEADEDVPFFLKRYTENYPFGNVHMALRLGPLVLENGVAHTKRGALISLRDSLTFHPPRLNEPTRSLALSEDNTRLLWWQLRPPGRPKRFKSVMKQVIGSPFTSLESKDISLENSIIDKLISASHISFDDPGLSRQDYQKWMDKLILPIMADLKNLIKPRLHIYIHSITSRLLDAQTKLRWSPVSNNCQNFCDSILDLSIFGSLIASKYNHTQSPLYLISFACRPAGYNKPKIKSKFDVPQGLTEEYLLRFRYGRHDDSDIIDTLQEYWYDWGAFGKPLYRYQDLFPWDCTEAFGRYPMTCGDCNLSKHVWAFPFDSWSIIALHLTRDSSEYPLSNAQRSTIISDVDWMKNRLLVLTAQDKLATAATEMAKNAVFQKSTAWLHKQPEPALDRLKLGGIHRAQPFSHYYDQGKYHHYFTASWAHLKLEDQVTEYELLRDGRVKLPDVEYGAQLYSGHRIKLDESMVDIAGAGGFAGFSEASIADSGFSVAGSMAPSAMDAAGTNCASGCGSSGCSAGSGCSGGDGAGDGGGDGGGGAGDGGGCGGGGCGGCGG
ncbi:hypothetical protein E0Z10_g4333 [Xylaria hypoxylon]|uniref:Uncharacterized protein n=1 Tax=Xylaria hypoxylon TaxID=37992 RepID=A0A4Z0YYC6_9PEZI|nr:hypothetical protein E0Z10_g4333 [Xylaria hypoxylon]